MKILRIWITHVIIPDSINKIAEFSDGRELNFTRKFHRLWSRFRGHEAGVCVSYIFSLNRLINLRFTFFSCKRRHFTLAEKFMYSETENNCSLLIFCDYLPAEWLSYLRFTETFYFYYELIQTQRFIELSRPNGDNLLYKPKPQKGKIVMQDLGCISSSVSLPKILLEFNHPGPSVANTHCVWNHVIHIQAEKTVDRKRF